MQTPFSYTACKIIRLGRRYIHVVLCTYTYPNANTMRTIFSPASRVRCAANAYIVQKSGSSSPASFSVRHTIACPFASSRMALRCAHNLMLYIRAYTIHCFQTHKEYTHTHSTQRKILRRMCRQQTTGVTITSRVDDAGRKEICAPVPSSSSSRAPNLMQKSAFSDASARVFSG